jgi:hypothetical protein
MKMAKLIQGHDGEWVLRDEWGIEDIRNVIETENIDEDNDAEFTDDDCLNIMRVAETAYDANIGLNWESIASAVIFYLNCKRDGTKMFYRGKPIKVTA